MKRIDIFSILIIGLILRLILVIVNSEFFTLPQGGADAILFERIAWNQVTNGRGELTSYFRSGPELLSLLGSFAYEIAGRRPSLLGIMMSLLGTSVIYLSYKAALLLWGDIRAARIVAWVTALFPQLTLHSALFLREIPVSLWLTIAVIFLIHYAQRPRASCIAAYAACITIGALFHSGVIFAIPAMILALSMTRSKIYGKKVRSLIINLSATIILLAVVYVVNETGYGLEKFGGSLDEALETFEANESRGTLGGAAFPDWMRIRGGISDIWKVPIRFIAFLFAPLVPLMVRSSSHLFGVFDSAMYLFLLWQLYRNRDIVAQNRAAKMLIVIFLIISFVYAMGVSNFGTAVRHRAKAAPLLIIVAAGLPELRRRLRQRKATEMTYGRTTRALSTHV